MRRWRFADPESTFTCSFAVSTTGTLKHTCAIREGKNVQRGKRRLRRVLLNGYQQSQIMEANHGQKVEYSGQVFFYFFDN